MPDGVRMTCMRTLYRHEPIVSAIQNQAVLDNHFLLPTQDAVEVCRLLTERFALPQWQFTRSASGANTDAHRDDDPGREETGHAHGPAIGGARYANVLSLAAGSCCDAVLVRAVRLHETRTATTWRRSAPHRIGARRDLVRDGDHGLDRAGGQRGPFPGAPSG